MTGGRPLGSHRGRRPQEPHPKRAIVTARTGWPWQPPDIRAALGRRRATLLKKGLGVQVACAAACKVSAKLTLKGARLGAGSRALVAAGTARLTVKLTTAGKRRLRKAGRAPVKLSVTVVDAGGKRKLSRTVSVRR